MSFQLTLEQQAELAEETTYTWDEIRVLLNNADVGVSYKYSPIDPKRALVVNTVRQIFAEEMEHWITVSDLAMSREEIILMLTSLANEFHFGLKETHGKPQ
jgi:hypothetical protein